MVDEYLDNDSFYHLYAKIDPKQINQDVFEMQTFGSFSVTENKTEGRNCS